MARFGETHGLRTETVALGLKGGAKLAGFLRERIDKGTFSPEQLRHLRGPVGALCSQVGHALSSVMIKSGELNPTGQGAPD